MQNTNVKDLIKGFSMLKNIYIIKYNISNNLLNFHKINKIKLYNIKHYLNIIFYNK